jgi:hypothetical protein
MVNHKFELVPGDTLTVTNSELPEGETWRGGGGKRNRTRKTKQEGGKKAMSGYMKFCQKMRPKILKENPGIEFKDVGKQLGAKWRALSDSEKKAY